MWRRLQHGANEGSGTENPEPDRLDLNEEGINELEDKSKGLFQTEMTMIWAILVRVYCTCGL